jgi:hypothetical protein
MWQFPLIQLLAAQSKESGKNMSHAGFFILVPVYGVIGKSKFYWYIQQNAYTNKVCTITWHEETEGEYKYSFTLSLT